MQKETTSTENKSVIIEANPKDYTLIAHFLNQNNQIHRHLDWFGTLDWLGYQPYLLLMDQGQIEAVLCATAENNETAWVRTFVTRKTNQLEQSWSLLLRRAIQNLEQKGIKKLGALALHPWFEALLSATGFINRQNIVVLEWGGNLPPETRPHPDLIIRPMHMEDLPVIQYIDQLAFSPLWQNSLAGLTKAYEQPGISTVAIYQGEIVGYQISTSMTIYGHLARLAVHPDYQRKKIAFYLVYDLLRQFDQQGFWRVTVNTQSNNIPSLRLYEKFGFNRTGEEIPVYELDL